MRTRSGSNGLVRPDTRPNSVQFGSAGGSNAVGSSSHMCYKDPFPGFACSLGKDVGCGGFSFSFALRNIVNGGVCGTAQLRLRSMAHNAGCLSAILSR